MDLSILMPGEVGGLRRWTGLWQDTAALEPFGHPDFMRSCADGAGEPRCAATASAFFPFLLREVRGEGRAPAGVPRREAVVPFGFGGAFIHGDHDDAGSFWQAFDAWARAEGVAQVRVPLLPFDREIAPMPMPGWRVDVAGTTAVVDLDVLDDLDVTRFSPTLRAAVEAGRRNGVTVSEEFTLDALSALGESNRVGRGEGIAPTPDADGTGTPHRLPKSGPRPAMIQELLRSGRARLFVGRDGDRRPLCAEIILLGGRRSYALMSVHCDAAVALHAVELLRVEICRWLAGSWRELALGDGDWFADYPLDHPRLSAHRIRPYRVASRVYDGGYGPYAAHSAYTAPHRRRHASPIPIGAPHDRPAEPGHPDNCKEKV